MKKHLLTCVFLILMAGKALAGTTTLTTFYPPPVAAYNQVKLSASAAPACNASTVGTFYVDNSGGSLHVCMLENGTATDVIYPQACFNSFCTTTTGTSCTPPACIATGFEYLQTNGTVAATTTNAIIDTFQTASSPATYVSYYVCCSS